MKKLLAALFAVMSLLYCNAEILRFSPENDFGNWQALRNLKLQRTGKSLKLTDITADSSITCPLKFDPKIYNRIVIKYKAVGVEKNTVGQIFYANDRGPFRNNDHFRVPSLIGDGKVHTMSIGVNRLHKPEHYLQGGMVTELRIDMADQPGGTIEIFEIRIEYDISGRYPLRSAEEPEWPNIKPELTGGVRITDEPYFSCFMISDFKDNPMRSTKNYYLVRKSFVLKKLPVKAYIQTAMDNRGETYINGGKIAENTLWRNITVAEVPVNLFKLGENVWSFRYQNFGGSGGVMGELFLRYEDGFFDRINTDDKFRSMLSADGKLGDWMKSGFKADEFKEMRVMLPPPAAPWRQPLPYIDYALQAELVDFKLAEKSVNARDTVSFEITFKGSRPLSGMPLTFSWVNSNGSVRAVDRMVLRGGEFENTEGGFVARGKYQVPEFIAGGNYDLRVCPVTLDKRGTDGYLSFPVVYKGITLPEKAVKFGKMKTASGTQFTRDGKPFYGVCGNVSHYGSVNQFFSNAVINLRTVFTKGWWKGIDKYDFGIVDQAVNAVLRFNPDALLLLDINMDFPMEWEKLYPEEMTADSKRVLYGGRVQYSFASDVAKKEIIKAMRAVLNYCQNAPFRDKVLGYRMTGGDTTEWLSWKWNPRSLPDYSKPAEKMFRKFRAEKFPWLSADLPIPSEAERMICEDDYVLHNADAQGNVIAYNYFYSYMIADFLANLMREARAVVGPDKALGTYYGYVCHIGGGFYSSMRGHYALKHLIDNTRGALDFVMSPQSYQLRRAGGPIGDMKPFATLEANDIISMIEDDTRTHHGSDYNYTGSSHQQSLNPEQSIAFIRRAGGQVMTRLQPAMFYNLCSSRDFSLPEFEPTLNALTIAGNFAVERGVSRKAEIAIVFSENAPHYVTASKAYDKEREVQFYMGDGTAHKSYTGGLQVIAPSTVMQIVDISRMGAPVDYVLAEDLADNPGNYKLYIFLDQYQYDEKFLKAVQQLKERQVTMVWLYAPGFYFNGKGAVENMEKLTGFKLKEFPAAHIPAIKFQDNIMGISNALRKPLYYAVGDQAGMKKHADYLGSERIALAEKSFGKALSIFSGVYALNVDFLQWCAEKAGVKLFDNNRDTMDANSAFYFMHAKTPGRKIVKLPRKTDVLDVFNGYIIARNVETFEFESKLHQTWLFYYGDDADDLLNRLKK